VPAEEQLALVWIWWSRRQPPLFSLFRSKISFLHIRLFFLGAFGVVFCLCLLVSCVLAACAVELFLLWGVVCLFDSLCVFQLSLSYLPHFIMLGYCLLLAGPGDEIRMFRSRACIRCIGGAASEASDYLHTASLLMKLAGCLRLKLGLRTCLLDWQSEDVISELQPFGPASMAGTLNSMELPSLSDKVHGRLGGLRLAFLSWISEFRTHRISMAVNRLQPKPALKPETSKKE
jgi:hypothetical protein